MTDDERLDKQLDEAAENDEFRRAMLSLAFNDSGNTGAQLRLIQVFRRSVLKRDQDERNAALGSAARFMLPMAWAAVALNLFAMGFHVYEGRWISASTGLPVIAMVALSIKLLRVTLRKYDEP